LHWRGSGRQAPRRGRVHPAAGIAALRCGATAKLVQPGNLIPAAVDSSAAFAEFRELVAGAGAEIVAEVVQRRPRPDPATLVGKGKVEEIAAVAASAQATLILFDHDLTPTQLRNLERRCPYGSWTAPS
jgi:50S ribosomal subunit-associated GTPase HflX